jgi:hypothetical protein
MDKNQIEERLDVSNYSSKSFLRGGGGGLVGKF